MEHELKIWPEYYAPVVAGEKRSELRANDRNYQVGDVLWLREWSQDAHCYTGRSCRATVTHVLCNVPMLTEGVANLSISDPFDVVSDFDVARQLVIDATGTDHGLVGPFPCPAVER